MLPTTTALAEPLHDADHRALRSESVCDGSKQQEGGDQGQCDLAVDPIDAVRHFDRAGCDHAIETRARMPEKIERAQISEHRIEHEHEIDPEQSGVGQPRQLHHQQEHEQADDEILPRVGTLPPDRDVFVLKQEVDEGIDADGDVEDHQYVVHGLGQPLVEQIVLVHEQDLQNQRDRQQPGDQFLRAAVAGVAVPHHPHEHDQRNGKGQILEIDVALEPVTRHGSPLLSGRCLHRPRWRSAGATPWRRPADGAAGRVPLWNTRYRPARLTALNVNLARAGARSRALRGILASGDLFTRSLCNRPLVVPGLLLL